jgi:hypothetical protein
LWQIVTFGLGFGLRVDVLDVRLVLVVWPVVPVVVSREDVTLVELVEELGDVLEPVLDVEVDDEELSLVVFFVDVVCVDAVVVVVDDVVVLVVDEVVVGQVVVLEVLLEVVVLTVLLEVVVLTVLLEVVVLTVLLEVLVVVWSTYFLGFLIFGRAKRRLAGQGAVVVDVEQYWYAPVQSYPYPYANGDPRSALELS